MTNREWLLKTSEYDRLLEMQENLERINICEEDKPCIMDVLGARMVYARHMKYNGNCKMCIAEWLREENNGS